MRVWVRVWTRWITLGSWIVFRKYLMRGQCVIWCGAILRMFLAGKCRPEVLGICLVQVLLTNSMNWMALTSSLVPINVSHSQCLARVFTSLKHSQYSSIQLSWRDIKWRLGTLLSPFGRLRTTAIDVAMLQGNYSYSFSVSFLETSFIICLPTMYNILLWKCYSIMELDEHLRTEFKTFEAAPHDTRSTPGRLGPDYFL